MLKIVLLWIVSVFASDIFATPAAINQTQGKLQQLNNKIARLQRTLTYAQDKRGILNLELIKTEQSIRASRIKLSAMQHNSQQQTATIKSLQQQVHQLNKQLQQQQTLLTQHIRMHYVLSRHQPMAARLNQDDPGKDERLLVFYQYLMHARKAAIANIIQTKAQIIQYQHQLNITLASHTLLQEQLLAQQQQFTHDQQYHKIIIQTLDHAIQNNQRILYGYEQNRKNLTNLLQKLPRQKLHSSGLAFSVMRHKLSLPIKVPRSAILRTHQGLNFASPIGTSVYAVYKGRVVFSDWLKGYGLLLIIDHGQSYMTLYAYNQSLLKHKGDMVQAGERISTVGKSGGLNQKNGLYFEIRRYGKIIAPQEWLHL